MRVGSQQIPLSEINVTPLVDVMLVLMIIFMVTAPLLQQGFDVRLPKATTSQDLNGSGLTITLTKDHVIYWGNEVVTWKELRDKLTRAERGTPVSIRADRYAYVDKLIGLWDLCREMGFHQVHIATLPE